MEQYNHLVTVSVMTYNSADYVLETLESVFNQSHTRIALVISDDCSSDATIAIAKEWIERQIVRDRFESIELMTVPENTGVSANCNRSIAAAKEEWVKFIAGDDILLPECIHDNMAFAKGNPEAHIIFSQVNMYQNTFDEENYIRTSPEDYPVNLMHDHLSAHDQYQLLLLHDRIHYTPSFFCHREALLRVGGYDESNRLVEDYPMWLKLTASGERLFYFHKPTVGYRIHSKAMNNIGDDVLFKPSIFNSFAIRKMAAHPFLPWEMVRSEEFVYNVSRFFQDNGWNKKTKRNVSLYNFLIFYLNPFHYIYAIKKRLPRNKQNAFYQ